MVSTNWDSPFGGTTLNSSNGFSSEVETGDYGGDGIMAETFDASSQLVGGAATWCADSTTGTLPGSSPAIVGGTVFGS